MELDYSVTYKRNVFMASVTVRNMGLISNATKEFLVENTKHEEIAEWIEATALSFDTGGIDWEEYQEIKRQLYDLKSKDAYGEFFMRSKVQRYAREHKMEMTRDATGRF